MIIIALLSIFIASTFSLPTPNGGLVFLDDDSDNSLTSLRTVDVLPSSNASRAFMFHPNATRKLENGEFFQGDMNLTPKQRKFYEGSDDDEEEVEDQGDGGEEGILTRTGILNTRYRWPKNKEGKVLVPYKISNDAKYSAYEKVMIRLAMDDLEKYTCVKYIPRTEEVDYIDIISDRGCHSRVGRIGGKQDVSLQKGGCFSRGTIIHELVHSLGYDHMQNHAERDTFVKIKWENINPTERHNFDKVNPKKYSNFGTIYDYNSVMHYSPKAFSINGNVTIEVKDIAFRDKIGQRKGLSPGDAQRVKNMYGCV